VLVVACDRPVTHHHHAKRAPADAGVDAPIKPDALVEVLQPLSHDKTLEDVCRHASCNPPPTSGWPIYRHKPDALGPELATVDKMMREPTGTRVRVRHRDDRFDTKWHARFVTSVDTPIPGGDCAITQWDYNTIECTTALTPEQLAIGHDTYPLQIDPPPELVEKIDRIRATWREPAPLTIRLGGMSLDGDVVTFRIAYGWHYGISDRWSAVLLDDHQHELGDCAISLVTPDEFICKAPASFGVLAKSIRLTQPP
jgi:hypothetical protein